MKYFVIPESQDGCAFPTTPEGIELSEVGAHIQRFLDTLALNSKQMGRPASFSNSNREYIPLTELAFTLRPDVELWLSEFSEAWRPPQEILAMVEAGELVDVSWHNDVCPSFCSHSDEGKDAEDMLRIWSDHPVAEERECQGPRFMVEDGELSANHPALYSGDDVNEAIRVFRETAQERAALEAEKLTAEREVAARRCGICNAELESHGDCSNPSCATHVDVGSESLCDQETDAERNA